MGLRAPGVNLSCPLCTRASYIWSDRDPIHNHGSTLGAIFKGGAKAYCPSCGISFRVNPLQLMLSYFKKAPLPPIFYQSRTDKDPEHQVSMIHTRNVPVVRDTYIEPIEEPSGIHLKIASKTIGLKIEMSVTGGKLHDKVAPMLSKAIEETSEACAILYNICKVQCAAWANEKKEIVNQDKAEGEDDRGY